MPNAAQPISRASWGARYPDGFRDRPLPISEWWLHHSVTIAPDLVPPFDDDDAAIRTLERIGQQRFGGGISYTYPVTPVGRLYVGHSMHRQGAHTRGHNTVSAAFVLVGDYSKHPPTEAQELAIAQRMVADYRAGKARTYQLNGGHRDASGSSTSCPGNAAHARIYAINALARLLAAQLPAPKPTPPTTTRRITVRNIDLRDVTPNVTGPGVKPMQRLLGVKVDGYGGTATRAALGAAQKRAGLRVDYVFGSHTAEALLAGK